MLCVRENCFPPILNFNSISVSVACYKVSMIHGILIPLTNGNSDKVIVLGSRMSRCYTPKLLQHIILCTIQAVAQKYFFCHSTKISLFFSCYSAQNRLFTDRADSVWLKEGLETTINRPSMLQIYLLLAMISE